MESITKEIVNKLSKLGWTIGMMESCTSGLLASTLTDVQGASKVFKGSLVTYSNDDKVRAGVTRSIIKHYGVYSKECAKDMAYVMTRYYNNRVGIGITGTLGNLDKNNLASSELGKVYCCIAIKRDSNLDFNNIIYSMVINIDTEVLPSRKEQKEFICLKVLEEINNVLDNYSSN